MIDFIPLYDCLFFSSQSYKSMLIPYARDFAELFLFPHFSSNLNLGDLAGLSLFANFFFLNVFYNSLQYYLENLV